MLERFSRGVQAVSDRVNHLVEWFLFGLGFAMAILMGVQVLCRYLLNHSLFWSEELGRICLVWITFIGASAAYKRQAHIGIDLLVSRLPPPLQRACRLAVLGLASVFFVILVVYGISFSRFVSTQQTAALGISQGVPYLALPISGVLFLLHALNQVVNDPRRPAFTAPAASAPDPE